MAGVGANFGDAFVGWREFAVFGIVKKEDVVILVVDFEKVGCELVHVTADSGETRRVHSAVDANGGHG